MGSWTPSPRKDSEASSRMAWPRKAVSMMRYGAITLGSMCRRMMRRCVNPEARAASTYGISRMDSALDRMTRAHRGIIGMVMARIRFDRLLPRMATIASARMIRGKRQQHVHEALQIEVDPAAEVRAAHAEHRARGGPEQGRAEADQERGARSVDEPGQDVASERVGAEPVLGARRRQHGAEVDRDRVVRRKPGRERGDEQHEHDDAGADGAERPPATEREERGHPPRTAARRWEPRTRRRSRG